MLHLLDLMILAVVQGLTEFLPVSSSGHLVLLQHWMGAYQGDMLLDVVLHVGTLAAVLAVYRHEVRRLLRLDAPALQYMFALVLGTVPAAVVGLLLKDTVESAFTRPRLVAVTLVITGLVLLSTRRHDGQDRQLGGQWHPVAPPPLQTLLIGSAQAVAILPGISRSGSTIAASLWLGLERAEAARFSFLLSVPAILGALALELLKGAGATATASTPALLAAAVVAFLVGMVALRLTALLVVQRHFWRFALYCLPLGVAAFVLLG